MNLVVTPLSSDFKKMEMRSVRVFLGGGFGGGGVVFFYRPPIRRRPHSNHVHLKVQITSMRSAAWGVMEG